MRALVQRVSSAHVEVNGEPTGSIGRGLLALLGVGRGDTEKQGAWLAEKIAGLRIFEDEGGKMNLSVQEIGGSVLVVSQFTLYGECRKGRRPSFSEAAPPDLAERLYQVFVSQLRAQGVAVETGVFQAKMQVHLVNDGPVTIWLDTEEG